MQQAAAVRQRDSKSSHGKVTEIRKAIIKSAKPVRSPKCTLQPSQQESFDPSSMEGEIASCANHYEDSFPDLTIAQKFAERNLLSGDLSNAEYVAITKCHTSLTKSIRNRRGAPSLKRSTALWQAILPIVANSTNRNLEGGENDALPTSSLFRGKRGSYRFSPWGSTPLAPPSQPSGAELLPQEDDSKVTAFAEAMAMLQASARTKLDMGVITAEA